MTASATSHPGPEWSPVTFDALWRRSVDRHPDRLFLRFESPKGDVTEWTYAEFDRVAEGVAQQMAELGVGRGDAVHLALTNTPTFVGVWLAAVRLGSWIVPSDPMATSPELAEHLGRTHPKIGFCAADRVGPYRDASGVPPTVIEIDEASASVVWSVLADPIERPAPDLRDRAAVMFTSGTTGRPKGVVVTQANYAFAGETMAAACELSAADRQLVVLPMFHANAQYYSFAPAVAVGAGVALMPTFSAGGFVGQAARHGATCASLFAGPIRMILARGRPAGASGEPPRLRHCWFAQNLTPDQYGTISDWLGCRPRQLYGMTETIAAVLTDSAADPMCDTMGYVTAGCRVELCEDELVVGGEPGITLFDGYLDDPPTTAASFRDGWFCTGDRATRDADGRFRFAGRHSDIAKVSGENVSLVEVEMVIAGHPDVADVAVIAEPDPVRDEVPVAVVVPRDGAVAPDTLVGSLERWCAQRLGKAKRPRAFRLVDELPRTSVGKIKKYQLKGLR